MRCAGGLHGVMGECRVCRGQLLPKVAHDYENMKPHKVSQQQIKLCQALSFSFFFRLRALSKVIYY